MQLDEIFQNIWPFALATVVTYFVIDHIWNVYLFWPRHGFKGDQPLFPILSDLWGFFVKNQMDVVKEKRNKYGYIYGTFFLGTKRVVVNDPETIRQITVKDFDLFPDHKINEWSNEYQRNSLVWIQGDHWKRVRSMMTPSFTSGKIKRMFKLLDGCADDLVESFHEQHINARRAGNDHAVVDLVETFGMYTMDGITTCCYGIKLKRQSLNNIKAYKQRSASTRNSLIDDLNKSLFATPHRLMKFIFLPKSLLRLLNMKLIPEKNVQPVVDRVQKMVDIRRSTPNKYDDLLQSLVDARMDDKIELSELDQAENHHAGLSIESIERDQTQLKTELLEKQKFIASKANLSDFEIISEAILLLGAGLETTRSSLSSIIYFLAHNPEVQERLYHEIKAIAQYSPTAMGKHLFFDYATLTSCHYLDAVISETMRIFTPAIHTDRLAKHDYFVEKYKVTIPKGVQVLIGIHSVHTDPKYWDEPEKFDPDRFMPGRREKIVPGTYMPFSIGPRHCIGMRFSLTETKLGLAKTLMNFKFEPAPKTKYPPVPKRSLGLMSIKNCKVKLIPRDE